MFALPRFGSINAFQSFRLKKKFHVNDGCVCLTSASCQPPTQPQWQYIYSVPIPSIEVRCLDMDTDTAEVTGYFVHTFRSALLTARTETSADPVPTPLGISPRLAEACHDAVATIMTAIRSACESHFLNVVTYNLSISPRYGALDDGGIPRRARTSETAQLREIGISA